MDQGYPHRPAPWGTPPGIAAGGMETSGRSFLGGASVTAVHKRFSVSPATGPVKPLVQFVQDLGHPVMTSPH